MPLVKEPNAEPIPGYRLIEPLGSGGFGDVWKCEAPGGLYKAIKFVHGNLNALDSEGVRAEQELKALQRVKEVRHPFVLSIERIEIIEGQLVIVMELADKNLHDRLVECQQAGLPGIPREELLGYMRDAAEALDLMNKQHDLQHLDVKPRNLFLVGNRVKVADFGLVKDLEGRTFSTPNSGPMGGVTPLYASPETFNGIISKHSDQYSLAIVYMEMLTGRRPFNGKTPRQLFLQHTREEPDLSPLPEADRPIVAKALSKNMAQRFPSCLDFVKALCLGRIPTASPAADGRDGKLSPPAAWPNTLEDLFLSPVEASPSPGSYSESSPEPLSAEELSRLSVTVAQPLSGSLRPTLIVGLGGFGKQAVLALRTRIIDRFGSLEKLPLLRYLVIDSDAESLNQALNGPPEQSLSQSEMQYLPLQRVGDYRRNTHKDFELAREWMPLEKWYSAPRSIETGGARGCRALGRLAFFYNYNRLAARLRTEIKATCDPQNVDASVTQTGLAARSNIPQVYILAAAGGGTGSGMLIDVGYACRRVLTELGFREPEVSAWLLIGAPTDPATPAEEQSNVFATLTEIRHFSDPTVEFTARYAGNPTPVHDPAAPFQSVYLTRMGHRSLDGLKESAARMAGYLFHDLTTPLGGRLTGSRLSQRLNQETPFRSFGTYSVWFPRGLLLRVAARSACDRLLEAWLTTREDAAWLEAIAEACDRRLAEPRWHLEQIQRAIEDAAATGAEGHPQQALTAFLATLQVQADSMVALEDPVGWCRQALERVHEWVGSGVAAVEETSEWRKSRLHRLFSAAVQKVAEEYADHLAQLAHAFFDQPDFRLAAADAAYGHLVRRCEERIAELKTAIHEQMRLTEKASLHVDRAMDECLQASGFSLFGRGATRRALRRFIEMLAIYARQRLVDELYRSILSFYRVLEGKLLDFQRDLLLCRKRLRDLREVLVADVTTQEEEVYFGQERERHAMAVACNYSSAVLREATLVLASRVVLPEGDADLDESAAVFLSQITEQQWLELDHHLQEHVLNPLGGLHQICMTRADLMRALGTPLVEGAAQFLDRFLPITDVCEAELSAAEKLDVDMAAQLRAYHHLATPTVGSAKADRELHFLVLPNSEHGQALAETAKSVLPNLQVIPVANQADLLICREETELAPADLARLLEPCRPAYEISTTSPLSTPHSRCDVLDWIPLEM